jgi:NAD(P)H-dependent FMN reductase
MKKILAFAGSTSSSSINKKLASFAAKQLEGTSFDIIDLRIFSSPVYSSDEEEKGIPEAILKFNSLLDDYDGFILALAEHNGSYTAAFKNIFDWSSRVEKNFFRNKPLLLMATSPGGRGGKTVLEAGIQTFPRMGAKELVSYSLPSFYDNFKENVLIDKELFQELKEKIIVFENYLNN